MTPREVLALCREKDVKAVDVRFCDFIGTWRQLTLPVERLSEATFEDGLDFSSADLPFWNRTSRGDLSLLPQSETAYLEPFASLPTLVLIGNVARATSRDDFDCDPRHIARKASAYLPSTGVADRCKIGTTAEFAISGAVRVAHEACDEDHAYSCDAYDSLDELGNELMRALQDSGVGVTLQRRSAGGPTRREFTLEPTDLVGAADRLMIFRRSAKNAAWKTGGRAVFTGENDSQVRPLALRVHLSLWKKEASLFAGASGAGLSETALHAVGGILKHAPAICALSRSPQAAYPPISPLLRPMTRTYSHTSAAGFVRLPSVNSSPKAKRLEFNGADAACNPYLVHAAILMAVIDGVQNKIHPGKPGDGEGDFAALPQLPQTYAEALSALENDADFLLRGEVFTSDLIDDLIRGERERIA